MQFVAMMNAELEELEMHPFLFKDFCQLQSFFEELQMAKNISFFNFLHILKM